MWREGVILNARLRLASEVVLFDARNTVVSKIECHASVLNQIGTMLQLPISP
jgi:hypothetical protein